MESILTSIKKLLGITAEYTHFDTDIIMHINSAFMTLHQLGVGPEEGFAIRDAEATWIDFLPEASWMKMEAAKTYIYMKVRLAFDPPTSSAVTESFNRMISEAEFRLTVAADTLTSKSEEEIQNGV